MPFNVEQLQAERDQLVIELQADADEIQRLRDGRKVKAKQLEAVEAALHALTFAPSPLGEKNINFNIVEEDEKAE